MAFGDILESGILPEPATTGDWSPGSIAGVVAGSPNLLYLQVADTVPRFRGFVTYDLKTTYATSDAPSAEDFPEDSASYGRYAGSGDPTTRMWTFNSSASPDLTTWDWSPLAINKTEAWSHNGNALKAAHYDGTDLWVTEGSTIRKWRLSDLVELDSFQVSRPYGVGFVSPSVMARSGDTLFFMDFDGSGEYLIQTDMDGSVLQWAVIFTSFGQIRGLAIDPDDPSHVWLVGAGGSFATIYKLDGANSPPNAPLLTSPTGGQAILRGIDNTFTWTFSDDDPNDEQSAFDLQIRVEGLVALTYERVEEQSTSEAWVVPAGTLSDADYEWRARTYDRLGTQGAWSAWEPFTAEDIDGPIFTDPTDGGNVNTSPYTVKWSLPNQDAYQLRRVADNDGDPDTTTIYFDTGTVTSSARQRSVEFPVQPRFEHLQVRSEYLSLWSAWHSIRVNVAYDPPAVPTVTLDTETDVGAIRIAVSHPDPTGDEPTVTSHDIWRRAATSGDGVRVAAKVSPAATHTDWTPASGVDYQYRVRATGDTGTTVWSLWV